MSANHYQQLAHQFDHIWQFTTDYETWMVNQIQQHLALTADETWLDFGAGTGRFSLALHQQAQPAKTLCAEPDAAMFTQLQQKIELTAIQACDQQLMQQSLHYDALLVKEVIHHLNNRLAFWQAVRQQLTAKGRILLITRPQGTPLALFTAAKQQFAANQPAIELLTDELKQAGYQVSVQPVDYTMKQHKTQWFAMLQARFMSDLAGFSDKEIAAGIAQLDADYPGEWIEHQDRLLFVLATPNP